MNIGKLNLNKLYRVTQRIHGSEPRTFVARLTEIERECLSGEPRTTYVFSGVQVFNSRPTKVYAEDIVEAIELPEETPPGVPVKRRPVCYVCGNQPARKGLRTRRVHYEIAVSKDRPTFCSYICAADYGLHAFELVGRLRGEGPEEWNGERWEVPPADEESTA